MNKPRKQSTSEDLLEGAELLLPILVAVITACSISAATYSLTSRFGTIIAIIASAVSFGPGFILGWLLYKLRWLLRDFFDN